MNTTQALLNLGINGFGVQLVAESFLKSPVAQEQIKKGEPLKFFMPVNRTDCPGFSGVEITLSAVPAPDMIEALGAQIRQQAKIKDVNGKS